jgi:5,6-dimethylbenzimidazole synthase
MYPSHEKLNRSVHPPNFTPAFRAGFENLLRWRRDVRHFLADAVPPALVQNLLRQAMLAPSVGFSQPWRWVLVDDPIRRQAIAQNFERTNAEALAIYQDTQAGNYAKLKLAGLREAPIHIAVFADSTAPTGSGLGRQTMPETLVWSAVMAIHTLWLAATAEGLGLGWVSILNPTEAHAAIDVPAEWTFLAYLCLGWPAEPSPEPLLERSGWERRLPSEPLILRR